MIPSAAALVIKALKVKTVKKVKNITVRHQKKKVKNIKHNGNISFDDVIEISKIMIPRSIAKELSGTVKQKVLSFFKSDQRVLLLIFGNSRELGFKMGLN